MSTIRHEMTNALRARAEYRFGLVLGLLLATFVFLMTGVTGTWARPVTVFLTAATLVAALFAANVSPRSVRVVALIGGGAFVASISTVAIDGAPGGGATALLDAALVAIAPIAIARSVVRRRVIDVQTVLAALCIYVLFAMLWAFVYAGIGDLSSSAFFVQQSHPTNADYLYFSFVTETTVGYGDLSAAENLGRACAVLEALIGQIYLVTIIALLVSRLSPRTRGGNTNG